MFWNFCCSLLTFGIEKRKMNHQNQEKKNQNYNEQRQKKGKIGIRIKKTYLSNNILHHINVNFMSIYSF